MNILLLIPLLLASCGGNGRGTATPAGGLSGYVNVPKNSNLRVGSGAARATAKVLPGILVSAHTSSGTQTTITDSNGGYFYFPSLPASSFTEVTASTGTVLLKMYVTISSGGTKTKNINSTTTAAAIIYEKLKSQGSTPDTIDEVENSNLIADLVTDVENALVTSGNYSYNTLCEGQTVANIIARVTAGALFSDTTAPALDILAPENGSSATDTQFVSPNFRISFTYTDALSVPDTKTLAVTIQLDSDDPVTIPSSNFGALPSELSFTLQSGDLSSITENMLDIVTNLTTHTATVSVTITDFSANTATATSTFTINPNVFGPPE